MSTCCNAPVFTTDYATAVCSDCGVERKTALTIAEPNGDSYNTHTPFFTGYSRTKRFEGMLDAVLRPSPVVGDEEVVDDGVQHVLDVAGSC